MSLMARAQRSAPGDERASGNPNDVNALLGRGTAFDGKLTFEGTVHINGQFTGEIRSKDTLVIGEGARVEGEIEVGTLIVNGELIGTVRAKQMVEMHAPARVKATISTPTLIIDRGVVFDGQTHMGNLDGDKPVEAVPPTSAPDQKR